MNLGGKCKSPEDETLSVLGKWWDEVKLTDLSNPIITPATQNNFGMMANGPTTGFACTYNKKCSNNLLCLYNKEALQKSHCQPGMCAVTLPADICSSCPGCVYYLCPTDPYVPSKITYPQSSCNTPAAPEDGMTYEMQATAQDMVNYYRRLVGSGWAPDKVGYALPAKKMIAVEYDCNAVGQQNSIGGN
ncbi:hypothetical protein Aduo_000217 [Ancylostoma duodenale]